MAIQAETSFNGLRNAAYHHSQDMGLPSSKEEAWRYVDIAPLQADLADAQGGKGGVVMPVGRSSEPGMVITNGCWDPSASPNLPKGVSIDSVAGDSVDGHPLVSRWINQLPNIDDIGDAWSMSDMRSGLDMRIDRPVDRPLIILNLATDANSAWRSLIQLSAGASATILLIHLVAPKSRSCVSIQTELAAGSRLTIDEVEFSAHNQKPLGQLFVNKDAQIFQDAELTWNCASRGGVLVRHRWNIDLQESGAAAHCRSGCMVAGSVQGHHHLRMHHRAADTSSSQLFKQVLDNGARCSFDGLVHIHPGADGSNAQQLCRSLIMDNESFMGGRPQLEVEADEVEASHGAAISRPQDEELLYLRSRGIDAATASTLLSESFLGEVARGFSFSASRALAKQQLARTLQQEQSP
ncbi:MAG: SufD family Fe-S cluster assembly protein [Planctomycetota bacterium]|nr:MAG: SufD family Fe-S cluster assembly protein [Planctomycetota bacterium]